MHTSNSIIKFADGTTVVGLITNNDETDNMKEVRALRVWCQENNLSLNVNKTKEIIMETAVGAVERFKFLGVQFTNKLKWSTQTAW